MSTNLGTKIRQLRKSKNISQEVLAQLLGVSFQAVSKWETGMALPDITLIPAIASFFSVSTDELFEYNRLTAEKQITSICAEAAAHRITDPLKAESILREGLKQFPGNDIILNNLLYTMESPERSDEIITICKTLIASTHDDSVKYDAIRILADTYHQTGQQALVEPTLELIPEIYFSKLEQMALLLDGEKSLVAAKRHMELCLDQIIDMLLVMRDRLIEKGLPVDGAKYARIAQEIIEIFQHISPQSFEAGSIYCIIKERLLEQL